MNERKRKTILSMISEVPQYITTILVLESEKKKTTICCDIKSEVWVKKIDIGNYLGQR